MESWLAAMAGQAPAAQPALFAAQLRLQKGLCFVTFWPAQHTLAKNALPKALLKQSDNWVWCQGLSSVAAEPVELGPGIPLRVPVSLTSVVVNQGPSRTHHTSQHTRPPHGQDGTQGRTGLSPTAVLDASRARVSLGQVHGQGEGHPTAAIPPGTAA